MQIIRYLLQRIKVIDLVRVVETLALDQELSIVGTIKLLRRFQNQRSQSKISQICPHSLAASSSTRQQSPGEFRKSAVLDTLPAEHFADQNRIS